MEDRVRKFNGKKITEARELHGLSAAYVAHEINVSRQSLSYYESGRQIPRPPVLEDLARVLKVKWSFFTQPDSPSDQKPTFFRSLAATTSTARQTANRKLDFYEEIVNALRPHVDFPKLNLPAFDIPNPEALSNEDIERFAFEAREFWNLGLGPIEDLTELLESNGVFILSSEEESGAIDAYSRWSARDGRAYVHLCTNKHSAVRSRFDLAHELAHLILHRRVEKTDFSLRKYFKPLEDQANRFASAFLLPEETFGSEIIKPSILFFREQKLRWRVSIAAMIVRSRQLFLIDEHEEKNLWIQCSRYGIRRREWFDDIIPIEEPQLIREFIKQYVSSGLISPKAFFSSISYDEKYTSKELGLESTLMFSNPSEHSEALKTRSVLNVIREGNILRLGVLDSDDSNLPIENQA